MAATLGNSKNKKAFIEQQNASYPDFSSWKLQENQSDLKKNIYNKSIQLKTVFDNQEKLAHLRQEQKQLTTELEYFNRYAEKLKVNTDNAEFKKGLQAKLWMSLWQECQMISEKKHKIGILFKLKAFLRYGISNKASCPMLLRRMLRNKRKQYLIVLTLMKDINLQKAFYSLY